MPVYEFGCRACGQQYQELCRIGEVSEACTACKSPDVAKLVSRSTFKPLLRFDWLDPAEQAFHLDHKADLEANADKIHSGEWELSSTNFQKCMPEVRPDLSLK